MSDNQEWITVKGARTHNLKNIDVKLPRGKFVVISGLLSEFSADAIEIRPLNL